MNIQSRKDLRHRLRAARRALSGRRRRRAETAIARRIKRLPAYRRAGSLAVYLPFDGEVDLSVLMLQASTAGKTLYLPFIDSGRGADMRFFRFRPGDPVRRNRFGILQPNPNGTCRIQPSRIDLVLMPLVGFDVMGARLGMGGGYYDRCFANLATRGVLRHRLVGVAFECQKAIHIEREKWDVPMSAVVTEAGVYRSVRNQRNTFHVNEENK